MAPGPCEYQFFGSPRTRNHARNLAVFCRTLPSGAGRRAIRVASGSFEKTGGIALAAAMLQLLALLADHRVQGPAHSLAVSPVLRRFARSFVRNHICRFSPALFDEHTAFLASGAAVPLRRA